MTPNFRTLFIALGLITASLRASAEYPRSELLINAEQLVEELKQTPPVVLDARSSEAFQEGRVPGAQHIDASQWKKEFAESQDPERWGERFSRLGIEQDSTVVVYDQGNAKDAARIWWILRYWGIEDPKLLDGGWQAWEAADVAIESGAPPGPAVSIPWKPQPQADLLVTLPAMKQLVSAGEKQIVDCRSPDEFTGAEALGNRRAGAIPRTTHLEWVELLDPETSRFKSARELRSLFKEAGIDLDRPAVTYCQSGGRASVMAFALELMGADQVENYYAGWSEWGNSEATPIARPPSDD